MKKVLIVLLCAFVLTGCATFNTEGVDENVLGYELADGEEILDDSDGMLFISVNKIPFDNIRYNDEAFSLKSLNAYIGKSESGHGYHPYIVAEFDLSTLSEDGYYWIMKDWGKYDYPGISSEIVQTFGVNVYIDSEQNNLNSEPLEKLKAWTEDKIVYYVFYLTDENKNNFSDMEISFHVNVEQDETYEYENNEGETNELNKIYFYDWLSINRKNGDIEIPILDVNDMPDNIKQVLSESGASSENSANDNALERETNTEVETEEQEAASIELSAGKYIVGEDIPAGKYDIIGIEGGNVHVCSQGKDYGDVVNEIIEAGETVYANVALENGYTVEVVNGGKIKLQPK